MTTITATATTTTNTKPRQLILQQQQQLDSIQIPNKEIEDIFNLHHSLSTTELFNLFSVIITKISNWIESVHLAVFTLEQNVKQDDYHLQDLDPLQDAIFRMEPFIPLLSDLSDIVLHRQSEEEEVDQQLLFNFQLKITKIQSEWSSLQHFSSSVKKQLMKKNEEKELIQSVERLLIQMDDVSLLIFDFQEKKFTNSAFSSATSSSLTSSPFISSSCSESTITTTNSSATPISIPPITTTAEKEDQAIIEIENAFEPLLSIIENIYHRIQQQQQSSLLLKRFDKVKEKWEILQYERDELKHEHKEDKWLSVFKRVADQVDVMIDGLDRSVVQCYTLVQQIKDWSSLGSSQAQHTTTTFDKFSKSFLKSFHHHNNNNSTTTAQNGPCPVDKEKFKSIEKSFEAKYKYYTPSIDRMLSMLGNGISARASRDNTTSQRHEAMIIRWNHLKEVMDELRSRDLLEAERIILGGHSGSGSNGGGGWKGIRYKTPEPQTRSITPNKSPRTTSSRNSPASTYDHYYGSNHSQQQQSLLRGSISDSSSVGSHSSPRSNSRQAKTPRPTRNGNSTTTKKTEDFYDEDERYYGVDLMKLKRPPSSTATATRDHHYIRSSSTMETTRRNRSNSIEKPITRSKTPNSSFLKSPSIRSKSSLGDLRNQRSMTPSLIPRPKTPTSRQQDEYVSTTMIPQRPKSQLKNYNNKASPPPVPPIPKYVLSHESDYAAYRGPKKQQQQAVVTEVEDHLYHPDPKDPLDVEVAHIVNASPISIQCVKGGNNQPGKYYFGNELSTSSMGGKKLYTCKLMTYGDRRGGQFKNNKVLIRVGGGWQDLEFFLLEHSSFMASDVVLRSFTPTATTRRYKS